MPRDYSHAGEVSVAMAGVVNEVSLVKIREAAPITHLVVLRFANTTMDGTEDKAVKIAICLENALWLRDELTDILVQFPEAVK